MRNPIVIMLYNTHIFMYGHISGMSLVWSVFRERTEVK